MKKTIRSDLNTKCIRHSSRTNFGNVFDIADIRHGLNGAHRHQQFIGTMRAGCEKEALHTRYHGLRPKPANIHHSVSTYISVFLAVHATPVYSICCDDDDDVGSMRRDASDSNYCCPTTWGRWLPTIHWRPMPPNRVNCDDCANDRWRCRYSSQAQSPADTIHVRRTYFGVRVPFYRIGIECFVFYLRNEMSKSFCFL